MIEVNNFYISSPLNVTFIMCPICHVECGKKKIVKNCLYTYLNKSLGMVLKIRMHHIIVRIDP